MSYPWRYHKRRMYMRRMPRLRRFRRVRKLAYRGGFAIAKKAAQMVKNRYLNTEFKWHDVNVTSAVGTTPTSVLLNDISTGSSGQQRDGDQYKMTKVSIKGVVTVSPSATVSHCRLVLCWNNNNAASSTLTWGNVFETDSWNTYRDIDNAIPVKKFRVLWSRIITVDTRGQKSSCHFNINKKLNMKVRCAAGDSEPADNALYWMCIGSEATNTIAQDTKIRIRFLDN